MVGLLLLIFKRATKAAALASLLIVTFLYYGVIYQAHVSGSGLSTAAFVSDLGGAVRRRRRRIGADPSPAGQPDRGSSLWAR